MNLRTLRRSVAGLALILFLVAAFPVLAQPVLNPGNGHYYQLVVDDRAPEGGGWTWQEAANAAAAMSYAGFDGHLVTVTSQQENDFLTNDMNIPTDAWMGGVQDPAGAEPAGGWGWITGEPWSFTAWAANEPNNAGGNEECVQWWTPDGTWNDRTCSESFNSYVVEFGEENVPARATFAVQKAYSDDNPEPVDVTLSCNTGLPLQQTYSLDPDRTGNTYVEFVVVDFESGDMDCEITEDISSAYQANYLAYVDNQLTGSFESCVFENVEHGDVASTGDGLYNFCFIGNTLLPSLVTVHKEWIDENPQFNAVNYAEASWFCSNLPVANFTWWPPVLGVEYSFGNRGTGITDSGYLEFFGNPGVDSFQTYGNWDGGTTCTVTEQVVDSGVEADDSDCDGLTIGPGEDVECTIVNTRLYEGIPTLSQYGLVLLTMLMLGIGLVAFRRFV